MKRTLTALLVCLAVVFAAACDWAGRTFNDRIERINRDASQPAGAPNPVHLALGNPSEAAGADDNFLLLGEFSALSYNRQKGIANWVSWRLERGDFGKVERQNDFRPDDRLPAGWQRVSPFDYQGSGFGRGHIVASADRTSSVEANSSTFLMTNIMPQKEALNTGPWEKFESFCRSAARRGSTVYVISGPIGEIGRIRNRVSIPASFWKIAVFVSGSGEPAAIDSTTRVIAVEMPNTGGIENDSWRRYETSVAEIETKTGLRFFTALPAETAAELGKSKWR
jgi:endonuclease G